MVWSWPPWKKHTGRRGVRVSAEQVRQLFTDRGFTFYPYAFASAYLGRYTTDYDEVVAKSEDTELLDIKHWSDNFPCGYRVIRWLNCFAGSGLAVGKAYIEAPTWGNHVCGFFVTHDLELVFIEVTTNKVIQKVDRVVNAEFP